MATKGVPNKNRVVGKGCDSLAGKADGEGGGSKHRNAGEHLMLDVACSQDSSEDFESRVVDLMEGLEKEETVLSLVAHSNILSKEAYLAQEGAVDLESGGGPVDQVNSGLSGRGEIQGVVGGKIQGVAA